MARNMYGATSADFTLTSGGRPVPGATLTIWSARTGGTQITDLLDVDSVACTTVTSAADGSVVYYGPNNDKTVHWADAGQGARVAIRPTDITGDPPVLSIGTVGTGAAAANLTGTSEAPVLNLTLPSAGANGVDTAAIQDGAVTAAKIANDTITATQVAANAIGSSELADNAVDTAAIADGAVTSAKLARQPGNLLTENQSKPTTTGAYANLYDCTEGSAGVFTAGSTGIAAAWTANIPVTEGETYTVLSTVTSASRTARAAVEWVNSGGSVIGSAVHGPVVSAGSGLQLSVTAVAPSGAVNARAYPFYTGTGSAGNTITVTKASFHKGAAGVWSLPGYPVTGQSRIAVNNAVDLSGTGTPEGVVTAAPGSTWLQTDATTDVKGWLRWVKATGTGNTGWVAGPEADTGWRGVTASLDATFKTNNANAVLLVRRLGARVEWMLNETVAGSTTGTATLWTTVPSGFRPLSSPGIAAVACLDPNSGLPISESLYINASSLYGFGWTAVRHFALLAYSTTDAWPTSLPGSAA